MKTKFVRVGRMAYEYGWIDGKWKLLKVFC